MSRLLKVVTVLVAVLMVGCTTTGTQYYDAIRDAAASQAIVSEARYKALAQVAQSGEPGAASAAVMAIALSDDTPIVPQLVESDALKWAQVVVPTMGTLGGLWMQTDLAKTQSNNSKAVQLASFQSNEAIQLGNQQMVVGLGEQWSNAGVGNTEAMLQLGLGGFEALNNAGDQTLGVAIAGFDAIDNVATEGFTQIGTVATTGFDAIENVSTAGFTQLGAVSTAGFTQIGTVAMDGFDALNTMSTNYNTTILGINDDWAAQVNELITNPLTNTTTTTTTTNTNTTTATNIQCNIVNNAVVCSEID